MSNNTTKIISDIELTKRMGWSFEQKIDHSLYVIENFLAQYPESIISFSGGLDSTVMLYLVRIISKNQKAVFCNTTNEFTEIIKFVKQKENVEIVKPKITFIEVLQQYGFPLISKEVAHMISYMQHPTKFNEKTRLNYSLRKKEKSLYALANKWEFLIKAPFNITDKCCYYLKKKPMLPYVNNGNFIGTKVVDSRLRKTSYQKQGCINERNNTCFPLSLWSREEILRFIKENALPVSKIYETESSTGCAYCGFGCQFDPTRFYRLQKKEPNRYNTIINTENNGVKYRDAIRMVYERTLNLLPLFYD
ncbi:MAG: phosphoadenosine phosphosulfate reductase family protein [Lutibacter sp.]|jgi:3'-phosphoadenosine 5'-phosphosulfate sulfotransferase (PAPS reductase)/FAD synthetase